MKANSTAYRIHRKLIASGVGCEHNIVLAGGQTTYPKTDPQRRTRLVACPIHAMNGGVFLINQCNAIGIAVMGNTDNLGCFIGHAEGIYGAGRPEYRHISRGG